MKMWQKRCYQNCLFDKIQNFRNPILTANSASAQAESIFSIQIVRLFHSSKIPCNSNHNQSYLQIEILNQINNTNSYISALARRILIYRIAL